MTNTPEQPTQPVSVEEVQEVFRKAWEDHPQYSSVGPDFIPPLAAWHKARMEALVVDIKKTCLERNQFRGMQNNIAQDTFESYVDQTLARHLGGTNE